KGGGGAPRPRQLNFDTRHLQSCASVYAKCGRPKARGDALQAQVRSRVSRGWGDLLVGGARSVVQTIDRKESILLLAHSMILSTKNPTVESVIFRIRMLNRSG